jgi:hypothetical protein
VALGVSVAVYRLDSKTIIGFAFLSLPVNADDKGISDTSRLVRATNALPKVSSALCICIEIRTPIKRTARIESVGHTNICGDRLRGVADEN